MRYKKGARAKFNGNGRTVYGTIVGRTKNGRKTVNIQVIDDQRKTWIIKSAKMLEKI